MFGACAVHLPVGSWQKMASAKFLEEALSTDVDESAVNAIVGSLETQLVTASPSAGAQVNAAPALNQNHVNSAISNGGTASSTKHGVANGGAGDSINTILHNSDPAKSNLTPLQNSVVGAIPASGYINQIQTTQAPTASNNQPQTNLITNKHNEPIKILYPNNTNLSSAASTGTVVHNIVNSNRLTFPVGTTTLPNGNVNLINPSQQQQQQQTVLTSSVQSIVSHSIINSNVNTLNKQTGVIGSNNNNNNSGNSSNMVESGNIKQGPSLVLKTTTGSTVHGAHLGNIQVPITTMAAALSGVTHGGSPSVVTLAKNIGGASAQGVVANHPSGPTALLPANVQILNVNAVRPTGPGGQAQKGMPQRVVIGAPHMMGARPGQPGHITLQALQGLQPGTSGHLLLKTENGQYQLLRVGAAPTTPAAAAITPTGSPATATTGMPTTTYRLQSVPVSAGPRQVTPVQQHTVVTAGTTTAGQVAGVQQAGIQVANQAAAAAQLQLQKQAVDSTKEKCRKFLANLLELSSREPKQVEKNVRTLIQELIDTKVEPEEFCDRLERLLNASPQPCLIGFLKKSLPLLRQALITKELVIEGIRPPPHTVVFSLAPGGMMVPQLQARGANLQHVRPQQQVRVMTPGSTAQLMPRAPHVQHRLVTVSASSTAAAVARTKLTTISPVRPHMNAAQSKVVPHVVTNSMPSVPSPAPVTMVSVRHTAPSISPATPKPPVTPKETKEKKTFSSSGYTGDDDINDVAAMGGVNLAEESQRILGSTEFVGTQIRSVKDEMFLHSGALQHKIKQILLKHGLEDPSTNEVAALVSHATQERLKNLAEKLAVIAEHRIDLVKSDSRYEVVQDTKTQLRFLEDLDRMERRRHEEQERELLLRAAKSRSKSEDPEQAKLKAKAKEMQRAEMEELRQREANLTALQAIGPRKKPKLDLNGSPGSSSQSTSAGPSGSSSSTSRTTIPLRPRVKRVNLKDLMFLLEQERETCRTPFLYKAYLK